MNIQAQNSHASVTDASFELADHPIVKIRSGMVRGESFAEFDRFLGIPYAQAPVGELRFQLPVPVESWDDVFDATRYGAPVPPITDQPFFAQAENIRADDNWLNLNVWVPKNVRESVPVFVWIFGGGNRSGSNAEILYDGDTFARDGIVYVNLNYRIGIEGFGVFPDAPHNRGIADQILALEWVRDNIAAFGGDPHNITIGGQSAGSMGVNTVITSPKAEGLFHRAILQSGVQKLVSNSARANYIQGLAQHIEIKGTAQEFAQLSPAEIAAAAFEFQQKPENVRRLSVFGPVIDYAIVPHNPAEYLVDHLSPVPLLIGYTADEFALWSRVFRTMPEVTEENLPVLAAEANIPSRVVSAYRDYFSNRSPEDILRYLIGDYIFTAPIYAVIKAQPEKAYVYVFQWENPQYNFLAHHGLELSFVFDRLAGPDAQKLAGSEAPQALADEIHQAWANFIKTGNPGWELAGPNSQFHAFTYPLTPFDQLQIEPRAQLLEIWE